MRFCLFYGTLRRNQFNFNRCGNQTYVRTLTLKGYDLYDCGLPIVTVGKGNILVELHQISEETANRIRGMELGAGYKEVKITVEEGTSFQPAIEASLYIYPPNRLSPSDKQTRLVKSGDWVKHIREKQKI